MDLFKGIKITTKISLYSFRKERSLTLLFITIVDKLELKN
jgi:hypothetical protein